MMPIPKQCAREGCIKFARGDEFCSRDCVELHLGLVTQQQVDQDKLALKTYKRKKRAGEPVYFQDLEPKPSMDAMEHRVAGSFETGKRQ